MDPIEIHRLQIELIAERQVVRYTCPICRRCLEDGPHGIELLNRGDPNARHRGGTLSMSAAECSQDLPPPPVFH